ncbi:MAG: YARHG domain-containing protein [Myxococcota bacterium]
MTRALAVFVTLSSVLACTGAAPEPPTPAPVAAAPPPAPAPRAKIKAGRGKAGRERPAKDPQAKIPATGVPDPLAGLDAAEICTSDELLMLKYGFDALQGGKCAEVCCPEGKEEHWCCGLDWPFSDVPSCDAYAYMRNGIFARYGYPFTEEKWSEAFGAAPYYRRREDFDAAWLSPVAKRNVDVLKDKEDRHEGCTP